MDITRLREALAGIGSAEETAAALEEAAAEFGTNRDSFMGTLMDEALPVDAAIMVARRLAQADAMLEVRLVRRLLALSPDDCTRIPAALMLRVLRIAEAISDCARLCSYLMMFLRHPAPEVRSKAALLIGRANLNVARAAQLLKSPDSRVRANAVESLWGSPDRKVRALLLEAAKDRAPRVAVNALVGLCEAGDASARGRLEKMAAAGDRATRVSAEWALRRLSAAEPSATPSGPAASGTTPD